MSERSVRCRFASRPADGSATISCRKSNARMDPSAGIRFQRLGFSLEVVGGTGGSGGNGGGRLVGHGWKRICTDKGSSVRICVDPWLLFVARFSVFSVASCSFSLVARCFGRSSFVNLRSRRWLFDLQSPAQLTNGCVLSCHSLRCGGWNRLGTRLPRLNDSTT